MNKKTFYSVTKDAKFDDDTKVVQGMIGTTGDEDRHGDTVNPAGWSFKNFMKNPVILYAHDYSSLPIGKAVKVYADKAVNGFRFDIKFADTDFAKTVYQMLKDGILNASSVGFIPLKFGGENDKYTIMKQELLELSIVPVPANAHATLSKSLDDKAIASIKKLNEMLKKEVEKQKEAKQEVKAEEAKEVKQKTEQKEIKEEVEEEPKQFATLEDLEKLKEEILSEAEDKKAILKDNKENKQEVKEDEPSEPENKDSEVIKQLKSIQKELKASDRGVGIALKNIKKLLKGGE